MSRTRRSFNSDGDARPGSRQADLEAFLEASRAASSPGDLNRALATILDAAIRLVEADQGSILMMDDAAGGMRIVAARGLPPEVRRDTLIPSGTGIAGTVLQTGKALLLPTPLDVSRFEGYVEKTRPIHSAVCVPLRGRDRVIGVLNLSVVRPSDQFDDEDVQVASLFAEHAAIAIGSADRLGRSERANRDLETLRGASSRLSKSLRLDEVVDAALSEALAICDSAVGMLVLTGQGRVELARYRGLSRDIVREVLRSPNLSAWLAAGAQPGSRRLAADPVFSALAVELGPRPLCVAPLPGIDGHVSGFLAIAVSDADGDVSRLLTTYAAEAALSIANAALHEQVRVKEEELETIVEAITSPIVLVDSHGIFRAINPAAAVTFHLSPEFEIGQAATDKLHPSIEELLFGQAEGTREVILPVGNDPHVWRATVTTTRNGPVPGGRLLVLDDVTLQRELEQRKADFLAVIGHELRTPLTIIRGFASTLGRHDVDMDEDTRADAIATIGDQSTRLSQLIEDLLYVSKIENRTPPLHLKWTDIVEAVNSVTGSLRDRHPSRSIALHNSASGVHLLFDQVKVEQVLRHLLDNAIKYSDDGTPILVRIADDADDVRITVEDKGIGIFSGDLPRLFRVFGQLDASSTRRHGGTGVGLSVCKTLVDSMGGRIWAQSMLGRGSEFTFTVPKTPPAAEHA